MLSNEIIRIDGVDIVPGEHRQVMITIPRLCDWGDLRMPVHVLRSKHEGPVLCITGAIHGDEINGTEIIRRLLKKTFLKKMIGTLIAVPIVNVFGFLNQDRYLVDRRDLNRSFPGSKKGSVAARIAHIIMSEMITNSTHLIDLHTGSLHRENLPQIRVNMNSPSLKEIALAFGAPVILHSEGHESTLRVAAEQAGCQAILYEAGEALRFDEIAIRVGLRGITQVMKNIGMLPSLIMKPPATKPSLTQSSYWLRANHGGTMRAFKKLGKEVRKGEVLAVISNPSGKEEFDVVAKQPGIIIGRNNLPLVHEGAALFHIASFDALNKTADRVQEMADYYDNGEISF